MVIVCSFAPAGDTVTYKVIGTNRVAVPTHFFKIVVDAKNTNQVEALAFVIPNQELPGRNYSEFLTSIKEIEAATGLDFLSALPRQVQDTVETSRALRVW